MLDLFAPSPALSAQGCRRAPAGRSQPKKTQFGTSVTWELQLPAQAGLEGGGGGGCCEGVICVWIESCGFPLYHASGMLLWCMGLAVVRPLIGEGSPG